MKSVQSLFYFLFSVVLCINLNLPAFAQNNSLPNELTENSSLAEIMTWLDNTSFSQARIGLHSKGLEPEPGTVPDSGTVYSEWAVFSQGFKLVARDGCHLELRNDDIRILEYITGNSDYRKGNFFGFRKPANNQTKYVGDLQIALELLNNKKGKAPYRLTTKPDKAKLLGAWQTKFIGKGSRLNTTKHKWRIPSQTITITPDILLEIKDLSKIGNNESMSSSELTFTFDDQVMSEKFYAAFRRAINLCNPN